MSLSGSFSRGDSPPECYCPSEGQPITVDEGDTASLRFNITVTNVKETDPDLKICNKTTKTLKDLFFRGVPEKPVQPVKYSLNVTDLERGVIHFSIKNATLSDNGMYQIYSTTLKRCRNYKVTVRGSPATTTPRPRGSEAVRESPATITPPTIGPETGELPTYALIALGVGSSIIVLIVLAIVGLIWQKRNRKKKQTATVNGHPPTQEHLLTPIDEIAAA